MAPSVSVPRRHETTILGVSLFESGMAPVREPDGTLAAAGVTSTADPT